ncbi:hypothetical protein HY025_02605 [Candidatus Daviesbacteria bacterium]|nr:hypothetical protein [Candidatus Daviesbacteria bacterium]
MDLRLKNLSRLQLFLLILFFIGLAYIILPGPSSIDSFLPLPNSVKSNLEGDTIQNPNIAAYFNDFRREFITSYYRQMLGERVFFDLKVLPLRLNHPPEEAYQYVRDQQESTFLEEYVFPLRESLFVNGVDPHADNDRRKVKVRSYVGDHIYYQDRYFNTKATLRYYPSPYLARFLVYLGIWVAFIVLYKLFRRVTKYG